MPKISSLIGKSRNNLEKVNKSSYDWKMSNESHFWNPLGVSELGLKFATFIEVKNNFISDLKNDCRKIIF